MYLMIPSIFPALGRESTSAATFDRDDVYEIRHQDEGRAAGEIIVVDVRGADRGRRCGGDGYAAAAKQLAALDLYWTPHW